MFHNLTTQEFIKLAVKELDKNSLLAPSQRLKRDINSLNSIKDYINNINSGKKSSNMSNFYSSLNMISDAIDNVSNVDEVI